MTTETCCDALDRRAQERGVILLGFVVVMALLFGPIAWAMRTYYDWADTPRGPVVVETAANVDPAEWAALDRLGRKVAYNDGATPARLVESRYRPRDNEATLLLRSAHATDGGICMTVKIVHYRHRLSGSWVDYAPSDYAERIECPRDAPQ